MYPRETIRQFDIFLADRGLQFEATVVGGAALGLLGVTSRQTQDADILQPELPPEIRATAREFAVVRRQEGDVLRDDWLNHKASSLARDLPEGWEQRLRPAFDGRALTLHTLGRLDLLMSKLFALCDRALDLPDCIALAPTATELRQVLPWLEQRDANPDWPAHVREVLADLQERLRHGL